MSSIARYLIESSCCIKKMSSSSAKARLGLLPIILLTFFASNAFAAQKVGTLLLDAYDMTRDGRNQIIRLKRNVQVIFGNQHLSADEASIDLKTKTIHAQGNLVIISPEAKIEADRASMEYEKNTGILYNAFIEMGQVSFEGEVIYKTGPKEFEVQKGSYTACTTCPPAWHFTGSRMTASYGGYAHVRNAFFHVAGVPVFWIPYMVVPLNSKRQTGFLFPKLEYGQESRVSISESYFWAMSDSTDSTWTLKNYQARGLKGLLNYRYVLTESSRGEFDGALIRDRVFPGTLDAARAEKGPINRWFLKYRHHYEMPEGYVHRAQVNLTSDLRYPLDFIEELEGEGGGDPMLERGDPALENRVSITKNSHSQHVSADATVYTNLLKPDPLSDNTDSVHSFPTVRYSLTPRRIFDSPLLFTFDMNYTNFTRDTLTYDDITIVNNKKTVSTTHDGTFDAGVDQIRAGQRLDFQPQVSYPFKLGKHIDILPSLAYRDTGYQFSIQDHQSAQRRLVRGQMSARTRFGRVFGNPEPDATRYKHEIQPEITYTSIPWLDQASNHPFFGNVQGEPAYTADQPISNSDVIQFDYEDRLYDRNVLKLATTNYLIRRNWNGSSASYSQLAYFRLQQSYDFFEAYRLLAPSESSRQPWSDLRSDLELNFSYFTLGSTIRYFHYIGKATNSTSIGVRDQRGDALSLTYSQSFRNPRGSSQIEDQTEDYILTATIVSKFIQLTGRVAYSVIYEQIQERAASAMIIPTGDCWGIHMEYSAPIQGEPKVSASFRMNYGAL
ncbi:MAG TPA: LPS assembly protein LptD [Bdellovibrionales bacterium]|nr:LPS assembly protein LptD [Bdellovibrionales bacterium]